MRMVCVSRVSVLLDLMMLSLPEGYFGGGGSGSFKR